MVCGDHDHNQRVGQGLVDVSGVLGVLGEPGAGGDDAVAHLAGGHMVEPGGAGRAGSALLERAGRDPVRAERVGNRDVPVHTVDQGRHRLLAGLRDPGPVVRVYTVRPEQAAAASPSASMLRIGAHM